VSPVPTGRGGPLREDWTPAPSGTERALGEFLRTLDIAADDASDHGNAFDRLRSGALQAVVVHDVYPAQLLDTVVQRLERHDPPFLKTWFPEAFRAWFFGRNVNLSDPDLAGYFAEAALFNAQLDALLPPETSLRRHVAALLSALDRGRPFEAAPGPQATAQYMFTTIRAHLEGGYIPAHFDNEQALRPSYRHLASLVDAHMLSFVLAFSRAEQGGALEVFDCRREPAQAELLSDDGARNKPDTGTFASVCFRLPPGGLIVLDSGRYLHRVTPVGGKRKRWTACSFMALSRDARANYCWG
jgi:hypothetical protein